MPGDKRDYSELRRIDNNRDAYEVGVISDTHGLLRPEAVVALQGVDLIIHAGDVGSTQVLDTLRRIAPVVAVRGNMDGGAFGMTLAETETVTLGNCLIHVLHDLNRLIRRPGDPDIQLVITGHTHRPRLNSDNGIVYLNPGSAGPRRFDLPITLARVTVKGAAIDVRHIDLAQMAGE